MYKLIEPEIVGGLGEKTEIDNLYFPQLIKHLHYEFDGSAWGKEFGDEIGNFFEFKTMRSTYPNHQIKTNLGIGNYGTNISGIFKNFVKINFTKFSNILNK